MCNRRLIYLSIVILLLGVPDRAIAEPKTFTWWTSPSDPRWSISDNWLPSGVPTIGDLVYIEMDGGPTIDANMVDANSAKAMELFVGTVGDDGTLDMTGGELTTQFKIIMGSLAGAVGARFDLSGGDVTIGTDLHVGDTGEGTLNMSGGILNTGAAIIVATWDNCVGNVNLTGGDLSTSANIYAGDHGDANCVLTGGHLSVGAALVIGTWTPSNSVVTVDGTDVDVAGNVHIGDHATATLNVSSGTLDVVDSVIMGTWDTSVGTYNQDGGAVTVTHNMYVGDNGAATLNISGGTLDIDDTLIMAAQQDSVGTVNISGTADVDVAYWVYVGDNGVGTLNISGGSLTSGGFGVAANPTAAGSIVKMSGSGVWTLRGDHSGAVNDAIAAGEIIADGARDVLDVEYFPGPDETVISVVAGDPNYAAVPEPGIGTFVDREVDLGWLPGDTVVTHKVYLSTSFDDVNNSAPAAFETDLPAATTTYDPEQLLLGTRYYWRINEVDGGSTVWEGPVWQFTTREYATVDDFELYDNDNDLWNVWIDAWNPNATKNTGSEIFLATEEQNVLSGQKAMKYAYDLSGPYDADYYAEIERNYAQPQNWASDDVSALDLWYRGTSGNDAEQMYIGLEDSRGAGSYAEVRGPNQMANEEWQVWQIDLQEFTDVNLADVNKVYIGFGDRTNTRPGGTPGGSGTVYIDDIRLYKPRCIDQYSELATDFDRDCIVNFVDQAIMAKEWHVPAVNPGTTGLVAYWPLDGDANDATTNGHDGVLNGGPEWVTGRVGTALSLDGEDDYVEVADHADFNFVDQLTVSCWVKVDFTDDWETLISKNGETTGWQLHQIGMSNYVGFTMRDTTGADIGVGSININDGRWHHVAGVYDGVTKDIYIDGELDYSQPDTGAMPDNSNPILIGRVPQGWANYFSGIIDEIRLYNRPLSEAEVLYLSKRAVDIDQDGNVNLIDLDYLVDEWLNQSMWP